MRLKSTRMRFGMGLGCAVFGTLSLAAPCGAQTPNLQEVLRHVRTATGAPYTAHIVSELRESADGRDYRLRFETAGLRSLVRRCSGPICEGQYFDGSRAYAVNLNDTALPNSLHQNEDDRAIHAITSFTFAAPDFARSGDALREGPLTSRDGRRYRRVILLSGDAPFSVLIDPTTWLPHEAIAPDGTTIVQFGDYRRVGRFRLPFELRANGREERFESRRVDSSPFAPPRGVVPTFASNAPTLRMVRVPREPGNEPVVPCTLGGADIQCLIDTGNSSLGVSLELAERLGLSASGEYDVSGIGRYTTGVVNAGPLMIGGATFPSAKYVVLHDLHEYGYDVVVGADVLAQTRVTLDYPNRSIIVERPRGPGGAATIPLRFDGFLPVVGVQLGAIDVPLALDTGDESAINLPYDFYVEHPGLFEVTGRRRASGIGGSADQIVGNIGSVRISTFTLARQPVAATRAPETAASGHLGSGFLSHFTLTLDYPNARFGLQPRANDPAVEAQ